MTDVPFDFHVHTKMSADAKGSIEEFCELAIEMGMRIIGFSEHLDLDPHELTFDYLEYDKYKEAILLAREKYADKIEILMGAEAGYVPRIQNEIKEYLEKHSFDYVIGSIHSIFDGSAGISDEYSALETFARYEPEEVYEEYFNMTEEMIISGLFDVVGHMDLVQRYGVKYFIDGVEWGNHYSALLRILEGVLKRQMVLEINTSGLRQAPESVYPNSYILRIFAEIGGRNVIIGSDAHDLPDLGAGILEGIDSAHNNGLYTDIKFKDRVPIGTDFL
jgi:histidinol-phosphatase (PHP family)